MADMVTLIKQLVQNVLNNWGLTDYVPGTVLSVSPMYVYINEQLTLNPVNLLCTSETPELASGDKVVMLKVLRGQLYIIIGKAVE